jgi:LacI family transcriptional regulator
MEKFVSPKRSITVADVAIAAKVSKATAARVLGGYGVVSDKIREQVMAAAKALDYRVNELARSMTTGKSGLIGVVVGDIENAFFSLAVRGISDAARMAGFNVIISNSEERLDVEKSAVDVLIGKRVDGLIVTPSQCDQIDHLKEIGRAGIPMVLFDRSIPELNVDSVTGDDRAAAIAATRMLIDAGHRRIAYITAMESDTDRFTSGQQLYTSAVRERVEGFLSVLKDNGIEDPEYYVRMGASGQARTDAVIGRLFKEPSPPTALLASDSLIGLEIFRSLQSLRLSIPRDVSMISFLDADWTTVTAPPITVVDQPVYEMGKKAAERLVARLKGQQHTAERMIVRTRIIERGSVGPPFGNKR